MSNQPALPERLQEVLRLAAHLTGQVLDAQIAKQPIPPEQVRALATAALLLDEHGVPLPSLLMQVLHDVAGEAAPADDAPEADVKGAAINRLTKLTQLFKGSR